MRADLFNGLALCLALCLASLGALWVGDAEAPERSTVEPVPPPPEPGAIEVQDARGQRVPVAPYERVVSLDPVADRLLVELIEPERLVGVTAWGAEDPIEGWRQGQRPTIGRSDQLETILGLRPDLVITSHLADESFMSRLRESGLPIFVSGEQGGVQSTRRRILALGSLLAVPDRARRLLDRFDRELAALEAAVGDRPHPPGLYLTAYGDSLFGGAAGSSAAAMLRYGGVHDLASASGYRDWPEYRPEQLLELDPALILTQQGMGAAICERSALSELAACQLGGRVIELPPGALSDPGLGLVHGAAAIQARVHPDPP